MALGGSMMVLYQRDRLSFDVKASFVSKYVLHITYSLANKRLSIAKYSVFMYLCGMDGMCKVKAFIQYTLMYREQIL